MKLDINADRSITLRDFRQFMNFLTGNQVQGSEPESQHLAQAQSRSGLQQISTANSPNPENNASDSIYKPDEKLLGAELTRAVQFLPQKIIEKLERAVREGNIKTQDIEEIQVDIGRHVRIDLGSKSQTNSGTPKLFLLGNPADKADNDLRIREEDLLNIKKNIMFNPDSGRGGIKGLEDLSRFSISEREGKPANITIRIGKALDLPLPEDIQKIVMDAVTNKKKVLFLGQTGVGKTTLIRQISRFLSDKGISPSVFDKSEEISGHGTTPHSILGQLARRFGIQPSKNVSQSLIQMIENHNPKVLIVDELSDREQFSGVRRTIDEKGIPSAFIFTHGTTLGKAMHSDNVKELLAKLETVIVGDDTAQKTGSGNIEDKIRHNVVGHSMIDVVVEMPARGIFVVHENTHESMKKLAAGEEPIVKIYPKGTNIREYRSKEAEQFIEAKKDFNPVARPLFSTRVEDVPSAASHSHDLLRTKSDAIVSRALLPKQPKNNKGERVKQEDKASSIDTSDKKQYPLIKQYRKEEITSMPLERLQSLQEQLINKKKLEGSKFSGKQRQLLLWVNAEKDRRTESGKQQLRNFSAKFPERQELTARQQREVDGVFKILDQINQENKDKEVRQKT